MSLTFLAVTVVAPVHLSAQERANPSAKEHELNEQAVRAMIAEDYPKAIALLEESRSMGESNVVYLNLGRAYQQLGNCEKAREMLDKVPTAPVVEDPSPELIEQRATRYLKELDEKCDEGPAESAEQTEQTDTDDAALASEKTADPAAASSDKASPDETSTSGRSNLLGLSVLGTGVALGATAVVLELAAMSQRNGIGGDDGEVANYTYPEARDIETRTNRMSTVALGLGIAGAVTAGVGVYFLTRSADGAETTVSVGALRGAPSLSFTAHW